MPAADAHDRTRLDLPPPYLLSASWDGTLYLVDMRDSTFMCDIEGQPRCKYFFFVPRKGFY
jgi:hypothetical protein